ncbi:MAG: hypothetical protein K8R54_16145, partial [Bacteroidales bacterium]|nr:hypothetical protein [Bacteroidales bacterium]
TNEDSTRVYSRNGSTGVSGGFAVGRYGAAKGEADSLFFFTNIDSTRVYTDGSGSKGVSGGFAVGRYGAAKGGANTYMHMTEENYFIGHQAGLNTDPTALGDSGKYNLFFGYQSAYLNSKGFQNTFVGHKTGYSNEFGRDNVFMGNKAGYSNIGGGGGFAGSRNVFLGFEAGYNNTSGADNVMIGWLAGYKNTTAGSNICIGSKAGYSNDTSIHNIFIGEFSGLYHKTGVNNIYMGFNSGVGPDTLVVPEGGRGVDNIFIGTETGESITTGVSNVFIGQNSGNTNTTGSNNVAVGTLAGWQTTEGLNNVFLGNNSGYSNAGGNTNVFIGNGAGFDIADHHNNIFIGGFAGFNAEGGDNNIFMGVSAGQYHHTGNDNVYFGNSAGAGKDTYTGTNERNVIFGANAGTFMDNAIDNVFIGHKAGEGSVSDSVTGDFNVIIGEQAGNHLTSGQRNVFLGNETGNNNTSGEQNVFLGYRSGYNNTIGVNNVFLGNNAGYSNTGIGSYKGENNVYIGNEAGYENEDGYGNVYIGQEAGKNNEGESNVLIGQYAAQNDTTGEMNVIIGAQSAMSKRTGSHNVIIGNGAGSKTEDGEMNVFIGKSAANNYNSTGGSNSLNSNVVIGFAAAFEGVGTNNVIIGTEAGYKLTSTTSTGNVFLGHKAGREETGSNKLYIDNSNTATPLIYGEFNNNYLQINSTLNIAGNYSFPTADGGADEVMVTDGGGNISWADVNTIVTGDNLGNHSATQDLDMNANDIIDVDKLITQSVSDYDKLRVWGHQYYTIGMHSAMTLGYVSSFATTFTMAESAGYGWVWRDANDLQSEGAMSLTYNGQLYVDNTAHFNGSVGIGNSAPVAKLEVRNSGTEDILNLFDGAVEVLTVENGGDVGIGTTNPGYRMHVVDNTASNDDPAIYGVHDVTAEYGVGVKGFSRHLGVHGIATSASGYPIGVRAEGSITGGAGTNAFGVYAAASGTGTGTRYGIYATASGGATAWSGYFVSNVHVNGTLSKAGGSFKIDHPLDPENKYLYHSFVESPDMMNIYNGNIILDGSGEAVVTMPDWFEVLNMEFRYQLTAIGAPGPNLYIAKEISGNTFKIAGGTAGMKVSWQVTGIRHDPFAEKNRIKVEVDKDANDRGKYLHPDVYNQPKEKGIDYEMIKK